MIASAKAPYPGTVCNVNRSDGRILRRMDLADDTLFAAIDRGIVNLFNDKPGSPIDARTGEPEEMFLVIDNYGGLSVSARPVLAGAPLERWYRETSRAISSWGTDGTVRSRARPAMNGTVRHCFVIGATGRDRGDLNSSLREISGKSPSCRTVACRKKGQSRRADCPWFSRINRLTVLYA